MQKKSISREEWEKKLSEVKLNKAYDISPFHLAFMFCLRPHNSRDLNSLVMNYLVIEGYKDAAEKFQQESGANRKLASPKDS